jgi:hypothetical protein
MRKFYAKVGFDSTLGPLFIDVYAATDTQDIFLYSRRNVRQSTARIRQLNNALAG